VDASKNITKRLKHWAARSIRTRSCCYSTSFPLEPFTEFRLRSLERNDAIKARIAGFVDIAHSACTDGGEDFLGAKSIAGLERHVSESAKFNPSRSVLGHAYVQLRGRKRDIPASTAMPLPRRRRLIGSGTKVAVKVP
jgi:hypothetical protein